MENNSERELTAEEKFSKIIEEKDRKTRADFVNLLAEIIVKAAIKQYHHEKTGNKIS